MNRDTEGHYDIVLTFKNPEQAKVDEALLREYRKSLDMVSRDRRPASCGCGSTPNGNQRGARLRAIETSATASTSWASRSRPSSRRGPTSSSSSPPYKPADFGRIESIIGRTAQLEFKIVDDGQEYMKKVAALVPAQRRRWDRTTSTWNKEAREEDVYLRSKSREALRRPSPGLSGDHDRPIAESATRRCRGGAGGGRDADKFWRTYYLHKRAALTSKCWTNADQTWDQNTGHQEVSYEFDRQGASISERLTGDNIGRKMAIILDDRIKTAPVIKSRIGARRTSPSAASQKFVSAPGRGEGDRRGAALGALPAPLKSLQTQVGPTMGRDAIEQGPALLPWRWAAPWFCSCSSITRLSHLNRGPGDAEHAAHALNPGGLREHP